MTDQKLADQLIEEAEEYFDLYRESFLLEKTLSAPSLENTPADTAIALIAEGMKCMGMGATLPPGFCMCETMMVHYLFPNITDEARRLLVSAIPVINGDRQDPEKKIKLGEFLDLAEQKLTSVQLVIVEKLTE